MINALKTTKILTPLCLLLAIGVILFLAPSAKADVGLDVPEPGGTISPTQKTSNIRMKNEFVTFTAKPGNGPFVEPDIDQRYSYYAHVKAVFTMQNLTANQETLNLIFPFHLIYDPDIQQAKNAKVTINGAEVPMTFTRDAVVGGGDWATTGQFSATFAPSVDTTIVVEYDLRAVNKPKNPTVAFEYMMQTGANWAGTIEHGEVVFEFENTAIDSTAPFDDLNNFFKVENGKLIWKFDNLKPTAADDINVSFQPYILDTVWPQRQKIISNLTASNKLPSAVICGNTRSNASDCFSAISGGLEYGVGYGYQNPSPLNVLTAQNITNANGWLVPYKDNSNEWLEFTFDGDYTIDTVQIRGGVLDTNPDYSKDINQNIGTGSFYDSFRRPKTVLVTFADGTQETVTLADTPQEMQELALQNDKKPTNKLRLTFVDNYPGTSFGNTYFGVGRVAFGDAKKVGAAAGASTTNAQPTNNWPLYTAIAAGAIILIGVTTGTVIILRHKRSLKTAARAKAASSQTVAQGSSTKTKIKQTKK